MEEEEEEGEEEEEEEDLWSLKVAELKEKCREKGLAVGGTHGVLVERLLAAIEEAGEEEEGVVIEGDRLGGYWQRLLEAVSRASR